jgi:arylsulfatase A-like enzyme
VTLADALKAAGYTTCSIGKWHISEDPLKNGFDINIAGGSWGGPYHGGYHSPYDYPNCVAEEEGEYLTDRLTNEAIGFIEKHRDRPFFLYFAHYAVHSPLQAKAEQKAKYDQKPGTVAHGNSTYAAMIESVDENLGRLFHSLQEAGIEKETLILFTSDNGGVWNTTKQWPLRAGKGSYYEGGIREPMIVFWDGKIEAGSRCDVPVSGIDFFPTLAEAAGAEIPAGTILDGVSLMPLLTGTGQIAERPLYWHFPIYLEGGNSETRDPRFRTRPGSVIRFGDWKLHEYFEDGGIELYNLADDIGEKKDLSTSHPERAAELHDMLVAWRNRLNAPVPTTRNPAFKVEN